MKRFESIKKKIYCTALLLPAAILATAQNATAAAPEEKSNLLAILLTVVAIVLAFIIWGLGQVLISVSRLALEKHKNAGKIISAVLIAGLLLSSQAGIAQVADATTAAAADAPNYGGLSAGNFYAFVFVLTIEITAILFLTFSVRRVYQELLPEKAKAAVQKSKFAGWWDAMDKKFFTKAIPVEKEADVLLDHNYDGIRELDNSLPPWWKYGFYFTILVGVVYLFVFHVSGEGKNPTQEYAAEMEKARIEKEAYEANNKDKVDENNVPMADASGVAEGKEIFTTKCWACHGKSGEGSAGPNLTDDYWIHKGSLNDIYHSIKVGYQDKGMQSWAKEFTPKQISYIASFIKTLHGTNPPNAKAPQGELFSEGAAADSSASTKTDSTAVAVLAPAKDSTVKSK